MTRFTTALVCGMICLVPASSQTPEIQGKLNTGRYLLLCQDKVGGFTPAPRAANPDFKPSLRATSAAVRALNYLRGNLPFDKESCAKFVEICYDPSSGGFADSPKGKPDVVSTAVGAMAIAALNMPIKKFEKGIREYLGKHVQSFEDIRIAVAGLESLKIVSGHQDEWVEKVVARRNADGTWGSGAGRARETGSAVVAVLRMKGPVLHRDNVLKALKDGQRRDGAFGMADTEGSDLETTYRVMRAFVMLNARPNNVEGLRSFVAKCRNDDHGFGVRPNQPSSVGATYFAATIMHWLEKE